MKYLIALPLVALALVGCNATQAPQKSTTKEKISAALHTKVINFVGPMDLTIKLKTQDNFQTAVMTDNSDRSFQMKAVPAASGVRMTDGKGASIHFKNGEGVVELVKGKPIDIQEFKK